MSITSSVITRYLCRGHGTRVIHEQHTDHTGKIHEHRYTALLTHDADVALAEWSARLQNEILPNSEKQEIAGQLERGADPSTLTETHITTDEWIIRANRSRYING